MKVFGSHDLLEFSDKSKSKIMVCKNYIYLNFFSVGLRKSHDEIRRLCKVVKLFLAKNKIKIKIFSSFYEEKNLLFV